MGTQNIAILTLTIVADGDITANRFVNHIGQQAGEDDNALGVARSNAALGESLSVDVVGTAIVEAGGAIAPGDALSADTDGRAVVAGSGALLARALEPADAAGALIEVLLIVN
ncbi:MAG: DUF2190 family protein [Methylobacillus sp.]|jgi:hypothetical protein|nr:DUF2190 family protein [Methylobacillus sp.]